MLEKTTPAVEVLVSLVKSTSSVFFAPDQVLPELEENRDFYQLKNFDSEERNNIQRDINKWYHMCSKEYNFSTLQLVPVVNTLTVVDPNNQTIFDNIYVAKLFLEVNGLSDKFEVLPYN